MSTQDSLTRRMLEDMMNDVAVFHDRVVKCPAPPVPQLLTRERHEWAAKFLAEELGEYMDAYAAGSLPDAVDALVDLVYVAIGRLLEMGIPPSEAWDPVQRANMAKERGRTKRGVDTDATKPDGWMPPDHETLIRNLALRAAVSQNLLEATAVRLERGAAYNVGDVSREEHFCLGVISTFSVMWMKACRMRSDINADRNDPKINRDHPRDIINYMDFMMSQIDGREL